MDVTTVIVPLGPHRMRSTWPVACCTVATLALGAAAGAASPPVRHAVIDRIPGPDGGYDYLSIDGPRQRLFVGRSYGVMAVDLATRKVTARLLEADDVAAVLVIPDTDLMLATAYGADEAILFDRITGGVRARMPTGRGPDAALYEPAGGLVLVMNAGSHDVTVIEPRTTRVTATIPLGGKPEAAAADGRGRAYVNVEDPAEIAVIDVRALRVVQHLKLPGCVEPTGIAYDEATGTLISACHNGIARLTDAHTGTDHGSVRIGIGADGAIFDPQRRLAYVPCKDGTLTVFQVDRHGRAHSREIVSTQRGARTAAFDAATGRLYLPAARSDAEGKPLPGTFNVLVVAPSS